MKFRNVFLGLSLVILLGASTLAKGGAQVSVKLLDSKGNVVAIKTVDADGNFSFDNIPAGAYVLRFVVNAVDTDLGTGPATSTGRSSASAGGSDQPFNVIKVHVASVPDQQQVVAKGATVGRQTQQSSFGEKVNSGYVIKIDSVQSVDRPIFMKVETVQAATRRQASFIKIETVTERATSGIKDTLKTQVRQAPTADIEVLEWSWGASNPSHVQRVKVKFPSLSEGVDVQVQLAEKTKQYVGHVTLIK